MKHPMAGREIVVLNLLLWSDVKFLLAVDLGVRTGLACYGSDGRLVSYQSRNFGSKGRLKRAIPSILSGVGEVSWLIMEGSRDLSELWIKSAIRRNIQYKCIGAEKWRQKLLFPREQQSGVWAKKHADRIARSIILWSEAPKPTSLKHDAAEAILIGLWGVLEVGWLTSTPEIIKKGRKL